MQKFGFGGLQRRSPGDAQDIYEDHFAGFDRTSCRAVKAPTLLYWGAEDTETPLWMGKLMEEKIPTRGWSCRRAAGHFAYLEHNQAFLRIAKFLLEGRA